MVRNSRIELFFYGLSFASSSLKGLRSISPSLTAFVRAAVRRSTNIRHVVALNVFLPLLNVQVLRKTMNPFQKSLSTSVRSRLGLPIYKIFLNSRLSVEFRSHTLLGKSTLLFRVLIHPRTEGHSCEFHAFPVNQPILLNVEYALRLDLLSQLSSVGILHLGGSIYLRHQIKLKTFLLSRTLIIHVEIKTNIAISELLFAYANRLFQFVSFFFRPIFFLYYPII